MITARILQELKQLDGTASEVAAALDLDRGLVRTTLSNLRRQGNVDVTEKNGTAHTYRYVRDAVIGRPRK